MHYLVWSYHQRMNDQDGVPCDGNCGQQAPPGVHYFFSVELSRQEIDAIAPPGRGFHPPGPMPRFFTAAHDVDCTGCELTIGTM